MIRLVEFVEIFRDSIYRHNNRHFVNKFFATRKIEACLNECVFFAFGAASLGMDVRWPVGNSHMLTCRTRVPQIDALLLSRRN